MSIPATSTFSVAGRCRRTGAIGAVVTSSSPAVGARCVRIKSGTGVVLTQNVTDPRLADIGLAALGAGYDADEAMGAMVGATSHKAYRQLAVVDRSGRSAVFSGDKALGIHSDYCADDVACIGNLLSDARIPEEMGRLFASSADLPLADRLLASIEAGFAMGGEMDQEHSIALIVFQADIPFPYVDLRIDYSDDPLQDMKRLWALYAPQADQYKLRALEPGKAPSFGVKGDE
ncbi:DUF1028 domain-containing protein [Paenibacillus hamazuiensis]|uniref:DUF1028 domain-containing protein n=1 Tax=Paenibacillus hamazuiensis TaxID=2936508 RepID=UPI00200F2B7C|nr:DUF1028 domain-containing protein [Paenibacillus hamazuiensis]